MSTLLSWMKWSACVVLALIVLFAAYMWWVVARFDTKTLPARHGQVDAVLYARAGSQHPLMSRLKRHGFTYPAEYLVVDGGHSEPLDEFPKMEGFLKAHFADICK